MKKMFDVFKQPSFKSIINNPCINQSFETGCIDDWNNYMEFKNASNAKVQIPWDELKDTINAYESRMFWDLVYAADKVQYGIERRKKIIKEHTKTDGIVAFEIEELNTLLSIERDTGQYIRMALAYEDDFYSKYGTTIADRCYRLYEIQCNMKDNDLEFVSVDIL